MEWPAAFAWKAPPRALRRLCTKKRPAVFAAGRFFQWLMKLYEETLLLVRIRLCLQAEGLVPGLNDLELGHPAVGMEAVVVVVADMEIFVLDAPLCSLLQVGLLILTVLVWVQWPGILMVFGLSLPMFCTAWIVYSFGRLPGMDIHDRMEQSTGRARNQTS